MTNRREQVSALVAEGLPNGAIARELGVSEKSVKSHVYQLMRAAGVDGRIRLALLQHHGPLEKVALRAEQFPVFSAEQLAIAEGVLNGLTNAQIAKQFNTTENAMKQKVSRVLDAAGKDTRLELAVWLSAVSNGKCDPPVRTQTRYEARVEHQQQVKAIKAQYAILARIVDRASKEQEKCLRQLNKLGVMDLGSASLGIASTPGL